MSSGQVDLGVDKDFKKKESTCTNTYVARDYFLELEIAGYTNVLNAGVCITGNIAWMAN